MVTSVSWDWGRRQKKLQSKSHIQAPASIAGLPGQIPEPGTLPSSVEQRQQDSGRNYHLSFPGRCLAITKAYLWTGGVSWGGGGGGVPRRRVWIHIWKIEELPGKPPVVAQTLGPPAEMFCSSPVHTLQQLESIWRDQTHGAREQQMWLDHSHRGSFTVILIRMCSLGGAAMTQRLVLLYLVAVTVNVQFEFPTKFPACARSYGQYQWLKLHYRNRELYALTGIVNRSLLEK